MKNELARELFLAGERVQYDAQCKKVLSQRVILAWILKYTMNEFRMLTVDEIVNYIEGTPEISLTQVFPGGTNTEKIMGMQTESKEPGEGEIYYDIRFFVYVPDQKESVRMIINVEAQKSFYPGYEIVTRGIFYTARMISAQLGTEFSVPDYDNIKKVCSVWICMNAPKYIGNAMAEYCFSKRDIEGRMPDKPRAYSKMSVCVVTLNEGTATGSEFLEMMNVLLSGKRTYEEKEQILKEKFHINMNADMGKELNLMCNLSEYVYESGQQEAKKNIGRTMLKEGYPEETILRIIQLAPEEFEEIKRDIMPN